MATTTYTIKANGESRGTKSKKAQAVALAQSIRNDERVDTSVETQNGTVVAEFAAPKKINMSKPYTRTVEVPAEVVETINGKRVAYKRPRVGFALLDGGRGDYAIFDLENKVELDVEVATTREAGRWFADEAANVRASLTSS